jgi:DNA repair protein RecN (Recombination protein N)
MLHTLRVKNLAIVETIRAEFGPGLNVVTGETGAGKSIIVGALGLVLGERADRSMIRAGEDRCGVEAVFGLADPSAVDTALEDMGLPLCEDGQLVLRRIVLASGTGKVLVNDAPATVQALKRIGTLLVDMHGPHDHQSLLSPEFQRDLLDSFGHLWKDRAAYDAAWQRVRALEARRRALEGDGEDTAERLDALRHQIREIEDAELTPGLEAELEQEHALVGNAQQALELADAVQRALTEDEGSAFDRLVGVQAALESLHGMLPEAEAWLEEARAAAVQLQELAHAVAARAQNIEADPARLQWLDDRLTLVRRLKRKYGADEAAVLERLDQARAQCADLETRGETLAALERDRVAANAALRTAGDTLHAGRARAADALAEAITGELRDLGFPHGAFGVAIAACTPRADGMDDIDFAFAPNVGEPMRALRAIASSGEISRVMLAVKAVLAAHDRIPVLVFDEIDANVGGEMGTAIGEKLATVSRTHQVLCITHLPQVAAHGGTHHVVVKTVADGRTRTRMQPVAGAEREEEIARMLGGKARTRTSVQHAREMLARARAD